jgi:hypothetical protein
MPLYQAISYTTTGTKASLNLDPSIAPFNASVACTLVAGSISYKLQFSLDPFDTVTDANALWFDSADIPSGTTASKTSALTYPVSRVRFIIASIATGPLTVQILQGLSIN